MIWDSGDGGDWAHALKMGRDWLDGGEINANESRVVGNRPYGC